MKRFLEVLFSLLLGLVLLESGLRVWGAGLESERAPSSAPAAELTLLCAGDSNVFGLYERAEDGYPVQLEAALRSGGNDVRVVNTGVPGTNTRHVVWRLPEALERERPRLVLLTSGANNAWSWNALDELASEPPWYERLALARFLRLARARLGSEPPAQVAGAAPFVDRRGERVDVPRALSEAQVVDDVGATIRRDLESIDELVRAHGARLWVVGYGADRGPYGAANAHLRATCEDLGIVFVDVAPAVAEAEQRLGEANVFHVDLHPRPAGYAAIAGVVAARLQEDGWLVSAATELPDPGDLVGRQPRLEVVGEAGPGVRVTMRNEVPGASFHAFVFRRTPTANSVRQLIERDPLARACLERPELSGRVGPDGTASFVLPASLLDAGVEALEVCYLIELRTAEEAAATGHAQRRYGAPVPLSSSRAPR